MTARQAGKRGERIACKELQSKGYRLLEANWRSGHNELDLIMDDHGTVVFVEVKARGKNALGAPAEAVDASKRRHMTQAALGYLAANGLTNAPARFDVVEVYLETGLTRHIPNAFFAQ